MKLGKQNSLEKLFLMGIFSSVFEEVLLSK
jgi:hypothetical protein